MTRSLSALAVVLALGAGSVAAASAAKPGDVVTQPDWVERPTPDQLRTVYPKKALTKGVGGNATIECEVALDGLLRKCAVVTEDPPGMDFGVAAIALAPQLRFKPATVNGAAVLSKVDIPIHWSSPGVVDMGDSVLTDPNWARAPTRGDLHKVYPMGRKQAGSVLLMCHLSPSGALRDCARTAGTFGGAALALAPKFRVDMSDADPKRVKNVEVQVSIHFEATDADGASAPTQITNPIWKQIPGLAESRAIFPAAALAKGIKVGHGTVRCVVGVGGALSDCNVLSEDPPELGFGDAARKLAAAFQLNPWTDDGRPVDGAVINIPIKLVYPDDAPAQPKP